MCVQILLLLLLLLAVHSPKKSDFTVMFFTKNSRPVPCWDFVGTGPDPLDLDRPLPLWWVLGLAASDLFDDSVTSSLDEMRPAAPTVKENRRR